MNAFKKVKVFADNILSRHFGTFLICFMVFNLFGQQYRVGFESFRNDEKYLSLAAQLAGKDKELLIALHYIVSGSELLYYNGKSKVIYSCLYLGLTRSATARKN